MSSDGLAAQPPAAGADIPDPNFLEEYSVTNRFRLGQPTQIKLTPSGDAVLFLRSGPRSFEQDLYEFNPQSGATRVLLTSAQVLAGKNEELTAEELARRERMRSTARGIATYHLSRDGARLLVPLSGRLFVIDRQSGSVAELPDEGGYPVDPQMSPDGRSVAVVRDGDLYVIDIDTREQRRLTSSATETRSNGLAEFVAQEEMGRFHGFWWSPDSRSIAFQTADVAAVETLFISDPTAPSKPAQPWRYPRPGKNNADVRLAIVSVDGGQPVDVAWDHDRYPYLATVRWQDGAPLTILVQNRDQDEETLLRVDAATGATTTLLTERDAAWINLDQDAPHWLPDGQSFLWTTERGGAWQLERRDVDGKLLATLTDPDFGYRGLLDVDAQAGWAYVAASRDPTQTHVYRVPLDPQDGPPEAMMDAPGQHGGVFARDHQRWVHIAHPLAGQPQFTLRGVDGQALGALESQAAAPPFEPSVEFVVTDGHPPLHAAVIRPQNFEPGRKYPVILHVYGGPHSQMVSAVRNRYLLDQWFADHGAIVVSLDGRGTPSRGRDWERAIRGDFIAQPLADQVAGLESLGRQFPELDLNRVGVFGWSFGGYFSAMAVMQRPDVFDVGVAGAPVSDWLDYDTHYTERYLGLPDNAPDAYERSSVLTYAEQLQKPLLLIHGTADDNVYFLHSAKVADRLFQAGVPFDFLPLVGKTHMVADPPSTKRLYGEIVRYLLDHLQADDSSAATN